jgi:hypothetical protein
MDWLTTLLLAGGLFVPAFAVFYLFCCLTDEEPVAYRGRHLVTRVPSRRRASPAAQKAASPLSGLATHLELTMPVATPGEADALRAILAELKRS